MELKGLLAENVAIRIIDVRTEAEYNELHIPLAIHVPEEKINEIDVQKNEIMITVCGKGGGRSERAAEALRKRTGNTIYFLESGTFGWYLNDKK
jgi:rhodanese-related sulfurtransferase